MKNIFFINPHNKINGGNKIVFEYCNQLATKDFKCFLVCDDQIPKWMKVDAYFIDRDQAKKIVQPNDVVIFHWDYDAAYALELKANAYYLIQHFIHLDESVFSLPIKFISVSSYIQKHTKEQYCKDSDLVLNAIDHTVFYPHSVDREQGRIFVIDRGGWKDVKTVRLAEKILKQQGMQLNFVYKEGLTPEEMAVEYSKADIFISSSWYEGFGLPPLEAMACGAVVVTTDSKGVDDFAIHNETCLKVPVKDPESLAKAIRGVVQKPDLKEKLRGNGLIKAKQFQWESSIDQLITVLGDVPERNEFYLPVTHDVDVLGDPVQYHKNVLIKKIKSIKGGNRCSQFLRKIGIDDEYRTGTHDVDKVNILNEKIFVPKLRLNILMLGIEENMEIEDFGERTRMIANELQEADVVSKIVQVCMPRFMVKALFSKDKINYPKRYSSFFIQEYFKKEKSFLFTLRSVIPERLGFLFNLQTIILARLIEKRAIQSFKSNNYVIWIAYPRAVDIAKHLYSKKIIFDAIDNMLEHPDKFVKIYLSKIKKAYEWVDAYADHIIIATEKQRSMFKNCKKLILMPNGVGQEFYKKHEKPSQMKQFKEPIVGYIGTIQKRFNVDLVLELVKLAKDFRFVFVGPVIDMEEVEKLKNFSNVSFLGQIPYKEVPAYIQSFDIAIIPHCDNAFTQSMNPLKAYEYLACGKPVVSSVTIPDLERNSDFFYKKDALEFYQTIEALMKNKGAVKWGAHGFSFFSWKNRINTLFNSNVLGVGYER